MLYLALVLPEAALCAPLPAFPGAEGFGALATGGRGGRVIHVTTLAESGPGSLKEAVQASGPRIVVFDVSGVIDLGEPNCGDIFDESDSSNVLVITEPDLTIAGQTAPGAGITIRGRLYADYSEQVRNLIVRHVRVRPAAYSCGGDGGEQYDALRFALNDVAIFDHVSVSWGVDENIDTYEGSNVTLQSSIIAEGATEGHPEGAHNYGILNNRGRVSVLGNLFAHNQNRNPALAVGPGEVIGNFVYDVRHGFVNHNPASGDFNILGNTFKQGPEDDIIPFFFDGEGSASYYIRDSYVDDPGDLVDTIDDPWSLPYFDGLGPERLRADALFDFSDDPDYVPATVRPSSEAGPLVLQAAGAWPRDIVDLRILQETVDRSGQWGAHYADDLSAGLTAALPATDQDGDGMADEWEISRGLDPTDPDDHRTEMPSGYTAVEEHVNCLADALIGAPCEGETATTPTTQGGTVTSEDDGGSSTSADPQPRSPKSPKRRCGCETAAPSGLSALFAALWMRGARRRASGLPWRRWR